MTHVLTADSSVFQLFQVRDFTLLWLGRVFSYTGGGRLLSIDQALHSLAVLIAAGMAGALAGPFGVRAVINLAADLAIAAALFALLRLRLSGQTGRRD